MIDPLPIEFDELFAEASPVQILNATAAGHSAIGVTQIEEVPQTGAPLLRNFHAPFHINKRERPAHRTMIELAAKGYTNKEIAEMMGRSAVNVNNAVRQPHSQQFLANEIKQRVSEDQKVVEFIKDNVLKAVECLGEIVEDTKARNSDRIAAAEALLNRRYGKPNQPINRGTEVDLNTLSDDELAGMFPETSTTGTSV